MTSYAKRIIDQDIILIPYYPNPDVTLAWYQDSELCRQVDNTEHVYDPERLDRMYTYLSTHGECFYIRYRGTFVGDVSLRDSGEISIVVCKAYQNLHIGRRCVKEMIVLAAEKGMKEVKANIYSFNTQSARMFESCGFMKTAGEWYTYKME